MEKFESSQVLGLRATASLLLHIHKRLYPILPPLSSPLPLSPFHAYVKLARCVAYAYAYIRYPYASQHASSTSNVAGVGFVCDGQPPAAHPQTSILSLPSTLSPSRPSMYMSNLPPHTAACIKQIECCRCWVRMRQPASCCTSTSV
jgi:hypothetical protein